MLGTQETSCIVIEGLLERDIFDLSLPEFDRPWVCYHQNLTESEVGRDQDGLKVYIRKKYVNRPYVQSLG